MQKKRQGQDEIGTILDGKARPVIGGPQLPIKFAFDKNPKAILLCSVSTHGPLADRWWEQLVELDRQFCNKGFAIGCFPTNCFGTCPGTPEEIRVNLDSRGVRTAVFEKINVKGPTIHPIFQWLGNRSSL